MEIEVLGIQPVENAETLYVKDGLSLQLTTKEGEHRRVLLFVGDVLDIDNRREQVTVRKGPIVTEGLACF